MDTLHPSISNPYYKSISAAMLIIGKVINSEMATVTFLLSWVFYSLGIIMFTISIWDWWVARKNYEAWKSGGFKKEEKEKYNIK